MGVSIFLWLIVAGITLAIDVITSTFLFIWFTVGAITAVVAVLLGYNFTVQLITFIAVSALLMAIGYPLVKKTLKKTVDETLTTEKSYIGRELTINEDIEDRATIKIDGIYWTVRNEGELIKKGDRVRITGINGNKILIRKI